MIFCLNLQEKPLLCRAIRSEAKTWIFESSFSARLEAYSSSYEAKKS